MNWKPPHVRASLAVFAVATLSGCATNGSFGNAYVDKASPSIPTPMESVEQVSLADVGLEKPNTVFLPPEMYDTTEARASILYINDKVIKDPNHSDSYARGVMPDGEGGYFTAITRWGVDCSSNEKDKHYNSTVFATYTQDGDRKEVVTCKNNADGEQLSDFQFTPKGIWVKSGGWKRISPSGEIVQGPRNTALFKAFDSDSGLIKRKTAKGNDAYMIWKVGGETEVSYYAWDEIQTNRGAGEDSNTHVPMAYVDSATYPTSMTGWTRRKTWTDISSQIRLLRSATSIEAATESHIDEEFVMQRAHRGGSVGTAYAFPFQDGKGNTFVGYQRVKTSVSPIRNENPFHVRCLEGPVCPGGPKEKGWDLPTDPSIGANQYDSTTEGGKAWPIKTADGMIVATYSPDTQYYGSLGWVITDPTDMKYLERSQMRDFYNKWGMRLLGDK